MTVDIARVGAEPNGISVAVVSQAANSVVIWHEVFVQDDAGRIHLGDLPVVVGVAIRVRTAKPLAEPGRKVEIPLIPPSL